MKAKIKVDPTGRKTVSDECSEPCAIEKGMTILGPKWKGSIIYHLKDGPVRFNDLARLLGGASKKMVDKRLKELESEKIVLRHVICERPIAVSYELTSLGQSALSILEQLRQWSEDNNIQIK